MKLATDTLDNGIIRIALDGRLDIAGADAIDMQFTALTTTKKAAILVDMSQVSFIASIGMRTLLSSSRALSSRGGKMVLANLQPLVKEALTTAGIDTLIPVHDDTESALADQIRRDVARARRILSQDPG